MNEIIQIPQRENAGIVAGEVHRFSAVEIRQRVNLVQEVMQGIMKRDTHYGTIPGTPKPTLYKPGAEVLCVTFRVAQEYDIEDLSTPDTARYRVTCIGVHQTTRIKLGEGVGECSSGEEQYKWRGAICQEEFDITPENMRRTKFSKYKGAVEKRAQVRTEAADLANTVLKMACKRAMIAMTLNVTAASDIFTQDIEDLPEELRGHDGASPQPAKLITEVQLNRLQSVLSQCSPVAQGKFAEAWPEPEQMTADRFDVEIASLEGAAKKHKERMAQQAQE